MLATEQRSDGSSGAAGAALGPTEGIWTAASERLLDPAAGGCPRWPETLRLRSSQGEVIRGRCKATNQCAYCARLAALENAELLQLDALHGQAPEVVAIVGTRTPSIDPADFYLARRLLLRAIRARWPEAETATLVEFTTGKGPRSGGLRRPHWNVLIKGVPVADVDELRDVVRASWCRNVDAVPAHQYVAPVAEVGGLLRYVAEHFLKPEQAPPEGWRGHRLLKSRGYLWTDTRSARAAARAALQERWAVNRQKRRGLEAHEAELVAHQALELAAATTWELVTWDPAAGGQRDVPADRERPHRGGEGVARSPAASRHVAVVLDASVNVSVQPTPGLKPARPSADPERTAQAREPG